MVQETLVAGNFQASYRRNNPLHAALQGQDMDMTPWIHPGTLAALGVRKDALSGRPSFAGNTQVLHAALRLALPCTQGRDEPRCFDAACLRSLLWHTSDALRKYGSACAVGGLAATTASMEVCDFQPMQC